MIKTRLKNLRFANLDKIVSINELSAKTGLSRQYLADMENGRLTRIDVNKFASVCRELGCKMDDLVVYESLEQTV